MAEGVAPVQLMFRAASETAIAVPISGSACTYLALQSTVKARPFFVPRTATTAASEGRFVVLFSVPTILSYCSQTHFLDAMFGKQIRS